MKWLYYLYIFYLAFLCVPISDGIMLPAIKAPSFEETSQRPGIMETGQIDTGTSGSAMPRIVNDAYPIEIYKKIVGDKNPDGFYAGDNISIFVQICSIGDETLSEIQVFEHVDHDAKIIKCLYPIRTSNLDSIFDVRDEASSLIYSDDFYDLKRFAKELNSRQDDLTIYIKNLVLENKSGKLILTENFPMSTLTGKLNKIIQGSCIHDAKLFRNVTLSSNTRTLLYDTNRSAEDDILLNRLLLEDAYPEHIKKSPKKFHEYYDFSREDNSISIKESNLYPKENLVYRYDVNLEKPGDLDSWTVVRILGQSNMPDYYKNLLIKSLERKPQFDVKLSLVKLDLDENVKTDIAYYIKYLGGSFPSCNFNVVLANSTNYILGDHEFYPAFEVGKPSIIRTSITYPKTGTFNLPGLTIAGINYTVEEHVNVEKWYLKAISRYYPLLSLILMFIAYLFYLGIERRDLLKEIRSINEHTLGLNNYIRSINQHFIKQDSRNSEAWNNIGETYFNEKKYSESIEAFNKAILIDPQNSVALNNKGRANYELGYYEYAILQYSKAIEINQRDGEIWYNKGIALKKLGKNVDANEAFAKAKELGYND